MVVKFIDLEQNTMHIVCNADNVREYLGGSQYGWQKCWVVTDKQTGKQTPYPVKKYALWGVGED